jgi:hypothetical protein
MSEKEQQLGEWRTNPFLDPQVRQKILELENEVKIEIITSQHTRKALEWIKETYPEILKQYQAMLDIEKANREASNIQMVYPQGEVK